MSKQSKVTRPTNRGAKKEGFEFRNEYLKIIQFKIRMTGKEIMEKSLGEIV